MSFVLLIVLLVIIWQLNEIRLNTKILLSEEQLRERRERARRFLWGRSE